MTVREVLASTTAARLCDEPVYYISGRFFLGGGERFYRSPLICTHTAIQYMNQTGMSMKYIAHSRAIRLFRAP